MLFPSIKSKVKPPQKQRQSLNDEEFVERGRIVPP